MKRTSIEQVTVVEEIVCDRCGRRAHRDGEDNEFGRMTSIGFRAGTDQSSETANASGSTCASHVWRDPGGFGFVSRRRLVDAQLETDLAAVNPERHGGEFTGQGRQSVAERAGPAADRACAAIDDALGLGSASNRHVSMMESRALLTQSPRRRLAGMSTFGTSRHRHGKCGTKWLRLAT